MIDFDHVVKQYGKSNVRAVDDLTATNCMTA